MSAFILDKDHIDYLVTAAIDLGRGGLYWKGRMVTTDYANDFGAMLIAENINSIRYRYPDWDDLPDPSAYAYERFFIPGYSYKESVEHIAQVLKAISCYEYQTCEHPEWPESEAKRVCDRLRSAYIYRLPGYEEAEWEVTRRENV
jgi:hypothetical protein